MSWGARAAASAALVVAALLVFSTCVAAASADEVSTERDLDGENKERRSGDEKEERDGRRDGNEKTDRDGEPKPQPQAKSGKEEQPKLYQERRAEAQTAQDVPVESESKQVKHGGLAVEGPVATATEPADSTALAIDSIATAPRPSDGGKHAEKRSESGSFEVGKEGSNGADVAAPPAIDVTHSLEVAATPRGNLLQWTGVKQTGGTVQVWRQDNPSGDWAVIATLAATGSLVDDTAPSAAAYKLTWSSQSTSLEGGTTVVLPSVVEEWQPALAKTPAGELVGPSIGHVFLGLLWLGAGLLGALRLPAPASGPTVSLRGLLARVPGIDDAALRRLEALGLGSTAQLMALDAEAVDFWAGLEPGTAKSWQSLVALTDWPDGPAGGDSPVSDAVASPSALPYIEPTPVAPIGTAAGDAEGDEPDIDLPEPIIDLPEEMPMASELADAMVLRLRRTPTA